LNIGISGILLKTLYSLIGGEEMGTDTINHIIENMRKVMVGKTEVLELAVVAVLCEGHILIEDVPGTGKTTLAKALARSLGCSFRRIQCTPDLLPSDITGIHFFNQKKSEFEFRPGPVISNIVLVDEINRATPRTQSSLLECMEERQVTIDGVTMPLPRPFLVIATQNPVELHGTFPLPEAQLDRFLIKLEVGYPGEEEETVMLDRFKRDNPLDVLPEVTSAAEIIELKQLAQEVHIEQSVRRYLLAIIRQTRANNEIELGASPRASLALYRAAQALALVKGRDYVIPDDVKQLATPVIVHRLIASTEAYLHNRGKENLIENILANTPVPVEE
jgi:MoxR-like ATPase